jgi:hypothetical protein
LIDRPEGIWTKDELLAGEFAESVALRNFKATPPDVWLLGDTLPPFFEVITKLLVD